jgi:hypothetical protein
LSFIGLQLTRPDIGEVNVLAIPESHRRGRVGQPARVKSLRSPATARHDMGGPRSLSGDLASAFDISALGRRDFAPDICKLL